MVDEFNDTEYKKIEGMTSKTRAERTELHRVRRLRHNSVVEACIRFGLRRFEHAFTSKKLSATIPPGWHDVCHVGLRDAMAEAGKIGMRLADSGGRKVDPNDPNAKVGTANLAFAHGQGLVAADITPFGHYRSFLMHMLSSGLKIKGDQIRLMLDLWIHCFEPFQEVSFFYLMCGGAGMGKSTRATRLKQVLCKGWIQGAGSSSQKAGMNGGMDNSCGRVLYYDVPPPSPPSPPSPLLTSCFCVHRK